MRPKIAIITDSCADVPKELREKYDIYVLPMIISSRMENIRTELISMLRMCMKS